MATAEYSTIEDWRPVTIEPFTQHYSVSSLGRVRRETTFRHTFAGRILRLSYSKTYVHVELNVHGQTLYCDVHTLVALAFHGPPPGPIGNKADEWQVDHKNGIKHDSHVDNLQWVTRLQNMQLASQRGHMATGDRNGARLHPEKWRRGEAHGRAKLTEDLVRTIRARAAQGEFHRDLAKEFGVSNPLINNIVAYRIWAHVDPELKGTSPHYSGYEILNLHPERRAHGERQHMARLTTEQVIAIRALAAQGVSYKAIARQYPVSDISVSCIVRRKTWKHVP